MGDMLKLSGAVPPPPVTGVKLIVAWFWVRTSGPVAGVAVTAGFTIKIKLFDAVAPLESVTVTVKLFEESVTEGFPEITPDEPNWRSAGSWGDMV
jgi:hypothetical protein